MIRPPHLGRLLAAARRRRIGAALALLVTIGVVVAIVLITQSSTNPGAANASSQTSGSTAVQRRDLVATDTESGTLSYANPQTVYNRLSGTITWLPSVGQVIHQGEALFKVDGQPVTLMNGSTPAYRDLNGSDSAGPDILQLNRDLIALGYTSEGIVADDVWQPATTDAVEVFQESVGESPTGSLSLGQIVFLPGSQLVSTVEATLGSTGASADYRIGSANAEFVSLTTTTKATGAPTAGPSPSHSSKHHHGASSASTATTLAALIALLKAESAELKAESAQLRAAEAASHSGSPSAGGGKSGSGSHAGSSGTTGSGDAGSSGGGGANGSGGSATAVLQTASTQLVATVDLDASKQSEAKLGEKVTVEMPAGNTVNGTITAVSPVAQSSSNSGNGNGNSGNGSSGNGNNGAGSGNGSSGATVPVTIALSGEQSGSGLDQAAVSVNFVQSEANNVLSVPVTALLATAGGGYAVQAAAAPHNLIPVTTGLFAAGYVEISGQGIYPGLQVTDSQG